MLTDSKTLITSNEQLIRGFHIEEISQQCEVVKNNLWETTRMYEDKVNEFIRTSSSFNEEQFHILYELGMDIFDKIENSYLSLSNPAVDLLMETIKELMKVSNERFPCKIKTRKFSF